MILNARNDIESGTLQYDVCIVGAGVAGITLAKRLDGLSTRVCLLESGGFTQDKETTELYSGEIVGHAYHNLAENRLRYFGGSSNHWSGICRLLSRIDFLKRDWVEESGWPFDFDYLLPYYRRAISFLQIGPFAFDADYWATPSSGSIKFAGDRLTTEVQQFSKTNFGTNYREDLALSTNVDVLLFSNAVEIELNESADKVNSVRVVCMPHKEFRVQAKQFVLALGGIENPRLMLLSNRIHRNGLANAHDLVGRYFMEHLHINVGLLLPAIHDLAKFDLYEVTERRLTPPVGYPEKRMKTDHKAYMTFSDETLRREQMLTGTASIERLYTHPAYESQGYNALKELVSDRDDFLAHLSRVVSDPEGIAQGIHWKLLPRGDVERFYAVGLQAEQAPNPASRVLLGNERDALGQPRVRLDWRLRDIDIQSIRKMARILAVEFGRAGLGRIQSLLPEDNAELEGLVGGNWHHMGTTRMHEDPQKGVVDPECRVHGLPNLFIAGSSVFPTGGHSVPTMTIVAMALRLSDTILQIIKN